MRWCLTGCIGLLALLAAGFGVHGAWSAPLVQPALGESAAFFQRVEAQRPINSSLRHCLTRKGAPSCHGAAKAGKTTRAPQLSEFPRGETGSAAPTYALPLPNNPPPNAGSRSNANHRLSRPEAGSEAGGPSPGFKFTGGVGVPTNRATLEGALSPYQQPNGNAAASTSGKLTNGIEAQGMHFGLEWHY